MTPLLSDARLARRASDGDRRAFAAIYERYHQEVYRFCLSILGRPEDAQEALQNTMVKALRALPGERREIQLRPWLYRVAHNESIDLLRRRREGPELDGGQVADGAAELTETVASRERLRRLLADLGELPERQRSALVMRELGGLDYEQIGVAFESSPAVARQTVYEARLGLRELEVGREMSCERVTRQLSEADGRVTRRRDIRAHLRACPECRAFRDSIESRHNDLAALAPLPAAAAASILHGIAGGKIAVGSGLGGATAAAGVGAGKVAGTSVAVKAVATVAVAATVGVTAADRGGLVDLGLPGGSKSQSAREAESGPKGDARPKATVQGALSRPASKGRSALAGLARPARGERGGDGSNPAQASPASAPPAHSAGNGNPAGGPPAALPEASRHGQETAAEHKAAGKDKTGKGHPQEKPQGASAQGHSQAKGKSKAHAAPAKHGQSKDGQSPAAKTTPGKAPPGPSEPPGKAVNPAPAEAGKNAARGESGESESSP